MLRVAWKDGPFTICAVPPVSNEPCRRPSDHAERCLGHVIGGVRGVYDRHAYREEMLIAYEKVAG